MTTKRKRKPHSRQRKAVLLSEQSTPPVSAGHEAVGFGELGACGKLTQIGTYAGKPVYRAAGGWYYCWNPDGGMWICRDAPPGTGDLSNNRYADTGYAADITAANWGPGFNPGMMPYGTVTAS